MSSLPRMASTPSQPLDRDLETAQLLVQGDPDGLHRLLKDHGGKVLGLLRKGFRGVLDLQEIDEAISQASERAWRAARRYDSARGSIAAWLYVIARNCARRIASTKSRGQPWALIDDLDSRLAQDQDPDREDAGALRKDRFLTDVSRCIDGLPPQQRAVLRADLAAGGAAPAEALAAELGTTRNSVYVSRANGRRALRAAMQQLGHRFGEPEQAAGGSA